MEIKVKEQVEKVYTYVAKDGRTFDDEKRCKDYEFFLDNIDNILKEFVFFRYDEKSNTIERVDEPRHRDFCFVKSNKFSRYVKFFDRHLWDHYFNHLDESGIYQYDLTNSYSGGNGWIGWRYIGKPETLKIVALILKEIESYEES